MTQRVCPRCGSTAVEKTVRTPQDEVVGAIVLHTTRCITCGFSVSNAAYVDGSGELQVIGGIDGNAIPPDLPKALKEALSGGGERKESRS